MPGHCILLWDRHLSQDSLTTPAKMTVLPNPHAISLVSMHLRQVLLLQHSGSIGDCPIPVICTVQVLLLLCVNNAVPW